MFDRKSDFGDKRRRLMEQSWAGVFRNHLLVELPVDDLCRHLDERMGRPSKDLHVVIGVLLLQQLHDLSDAETVEALAFNMAWHYALDVRSEADSYFCEKTLRNYRRLFIEQGLDELLFRCLTDRWRGIQILNDLRRRALVVGHDAMTIGIEQFRAPGDMRLDRMLIQPFKGDAGSTYPIDRADGGETAPNRRGTRARENSVSIGATNDQYPPESGRVRRMPAQV